MSSTRFTFLRIIILLGVFYSMFANAVIVESINTYLRTNTADTWTTFKTITLGQSVTLTTFYNNNTNSAQAGDVTQRIQSVFPSGTSNVVPNGTSVTPTNTGLYLIRAATQDNSFNSTAWLLVVSASVSNVLWSDLAPTSIVPDNASPVEGDTVFFDSGVVNNNAINSTSFNIKWLVNGNEVGAYGSHAGVPGNTTLLNDNSQFTWTAQPGQHVISFIVDADNHITESNEQNNRIDYTITVNAASPPAELEALPIRYRRDGYVPGQGILFNAGIKNSGGQDSDYFNVKWLLNGQEFGAYGSHISLAPNETRYDDNSTLHWNIQPGNHVITFIADVDNYVLETNEQNNRFEIFWGDGSVSSVVQSAHFLVNQARLMWENPAGPGGYPPRDHNEFGYYFSDGPGQYYDRSLFAFTDIQRSNCWEMVMLAALSAGAVTEEELSAVYDLEPGELLGDSVSAFFGVNADMPAYDFVNNTPNAGDIVFFVGMSGPLSHVAMYLDKQGSEHRVFSLWNTPPTNDGSPVNVPRVVTVSSLQSASNASKIIVLPPPWQ